MVDCPNGRTQTFIKVSERLFEVVIFTKSDHMHTSKKIDIMWQWFPESLVFNTGNKCTFKKLQKTPPAMMTKVDYVIVWGKIRSGEFFNRYPQRVLMGLWQHQSWKKAVIGGYYPKSDAQACGISSPRELIQKRQWSTSRSWYED